MRHLDCQFLCSTCGNRKCAYKSFTEYKNTFPKKIRHINILAVRSCYKNMTLYSVEMNWDFSSLCISKHKIVTLETILLYDTFVRYMLRMYAADPALNSE